jgi:hypothetical protein
MVLNKDCNDCRLTKDQCACINAILPAEIKLKLDALSQKKSPTAQINENY